jgi:hypothetical protein
MSALTMARPVEVAHHVQVLEAFAMGASRHYRVRCIDCQERTSWRPRIGWALEALSVWHPR